MRILSFIKEVINQASPKMTDYWKERNKGITDKNTPKVFRVLRKRLENPLHRVKSVFTGHLP